MICNYCHNDLSPDCFYYRQDGTLNGRKCKACKNAEASITYKTKGGIDHLRKWRKANPEKYKEQRKIQLAKRSERLKVDPAYREKLNQQKREGAKRNFIVGMVARARLRAIKYNVPFSITAADIIVPDLCPLLEIPLVYGSRNDYQASPSIDRIVPEKGYTKDNIRVISTLANTMKNSATIEQLLIFSKNVQNYVQGMI